MIKAIIFDVDDTLYDQKSPFSAAIQQTFKLPFTPTELAQIFKRFRDFNDRTFEQVATNELSLEAWQTARLRHAMTDLTTTTITTDWAIQFEMAYHKALANIELFPGLGTTLEKLSHCFEIGIITNGPTATQRHKLQQLQIQRYVHPDNIFISEELGIAKPDPSIFTTWAHQAGIRANQAAYVGDNAALDMTSAKHAGWQTFWFNHRQNMQSQPTVIPDQIIQSPDELNDLLLALAQAAV
ncbi:HAD family hydrolase [Lactiplantibacillus fabifermentans]|uniref:HAD superfamily hydrolase n=2 Tax=Lactiplantibacillus fabifermentans TaxID=483011 RepID=A0A0R2NIX4_9LACO|nr:HAD family hydrolase [Lactiplantibacillus fabifermentans]ETY74116.1 HAD family hydrolase [Lactiplantibacillus fabifermentans T30PCM01]KRO25717.1 HAD superfamily hydrolase [Lactiplantibacillus fabifermentans DSM 21115]